MLSKKKSTWEEVQLRNFFQIKHGFAFKSKYFEEEGDFLVLTPGNFNEDGGLKFRESKEKYYSGNFKDEYLLKKGDLLVVMTDLKQDAPILGSPAFIPESGKYLHNQRLGKIIDLQDDLDIVFLYYFFNSTLFREQIKSTATGATVKHTSPDRILDVKVKIPSLDIQKKIGQTLRSFDDLVEVNLRRIEVLEEVARCLYEEWFIHLRYPGHENKENTQTPHGPTPKGWKWEKLGDVIELAYGKGLKKDARIEGKYPVYGSSGIVGTHNEFLVEGPTIILGRKGNVGSIFWSIENCYPIDTVFYVNADLSLYYTFYNFHYQNFINSDAAVPGLSRNQAYTLPLLMPSEDILNKFDKQIKPIFEQIQILTNQNEVLKQTRDLLLPKLISGEIDVSDIDIQL